MALRDHIRIRLRKYLLKLSSLIHSFYKTDVIIISYPRSGRTWLNHIAGLILARHYNLADDPKRLSLWSTYSRRTPGVEFKHDMNSFEFMILKKKKYIYLIRDMRDVSVSHYHWRVSREKYQYKNISEFIRDKQFGVSAHIKHANKWIRRIEGKKKHSSLIISYEMLHNAPLDTVKKLSVLLNMHGLSDDFIQKTIDDSRFDAMKEKERKRSSLKDKNSLHVRKGRIGGSKEEVYEPELAYISNMIKQKLDNRFEELCGIDYYHPPGRS